MRGIFAYVDIEHPVVAWAAYRGSLVSVNAEFSPPNCPVSMMFSGMLYNQNHSRLLNELIIEKYRQKYFPQKNSDLNRPK
jgi:hypothetical protein